jgi:hypothetical protein
MKYDKLNGNYFLERNFCSECGKRRMTAPLSWDEPKWKSDSLKYNGRNRGTEHLCRACASEYPGFQKG